MIWASDRSRRPALSAGLPAGAVRHAYQPRLRWQPASDVARVEEDADRSMTQLAITCHERRSAGGAGVGVALTARLHRPRPPPPFRHRSWKAVEVPRSGVSSCLQPHREHGHFTGFSRCPGWVHEAHRRRLPVGHRTGPPPTARLSRTRRRTRQRNALGEGARSARRALRQLHERRQEGAGARGVQAVRHVRRVARAVADDRGGREPVRPRRTPRPRQAGRPRRQPPRARAHRRLHTRPRRRQPSAAAPARRHARPAQDLPGAAAAPADPTSLLLRELHDILRADPADNRSLDELGGRSAPAPARSPAASATTSASPTPNGAPRSGSTTH